MVDKKPSIKCKYKFAEDYNPVYANGAQGGINLQGEIVINFYLERGALPKSQTLLVKDQIISDEIIETEPVDLSTSFIRYVQNGVIMNYKTAKEVHSWLGKHLENLETLEHGNKK